MSANNIIMNSCQYTPVYFIENPAVGQARSYVITQNNQEVEKPVCENLKQFYENSGKLETNLSVANSIPKQKILKRTESNVVGNNLKLASFLIPKTEIKAEPCKPLITPVNNVVLKPVYIANNVASQHTVPKVDVNSKIVMLKDFPNIIRSQNGKILPKIKPKENTTVKSKHTSVQLLKLGETYHSLNQLSDNQMKIVNHALKIFSDPQGSPEPTYDPVTNTKYIYKVVSPKDLAVVGKNKNKQKADIPTVTLKSELEDIDNDELKVLETKVTRSGRIVKLPKSIINESPTKPKRKNVQSVECSRCPSKFTSPQRLHRHYEEHNLANHSDLFQCFRNIIKTSSDNNFVQQIEQFIIKLKSCTSCLLADNGNGIPSIINEDVARLLGISPGKYNLNLDALNCEKDKNGYCSHNPEPKPMEVDKPKTIENNETISDLSEFILINHKQKDTQPNIKKIDNRKQKLVSTQNYNGKKIKITPDIDKNNVIDDIIALLNDTDKTESSLDKTIDNVELSTNMQNEIKIVPTVNGKPTHLQFRSTHFDIRSSPIKSSSTVFRKFQINPANMENCEVQQEIRPINKLAQDIEMTDTSHTEQDISIETNEIMETSDTEIQNVLKDTHAVHDSSATEDWPLIDQSDFLKSNESLETILHKDGGENMNDEGQSIISFLESLGNELYSETEKTNPVDLQLDLFSFNS